jgi:hypothetical protein
MSAQQLPPINATSVENWEPWDGGDGSGMLAQEGTYRGLITAIVPGLSKAKGGESAKGFLKVTMTVQDPDADQCRLVTRVMYAGADKNGENLWTKFLEFLASIGMATEACRALSAQVHGKSIQEVVAGLGLVGQIAHFRAKYDVYEGALKTVVDSFITPAVATADFEGKVARKRKATDPGLLEAILAAKQGANKQQFGRIGAAPTAFAGAPSLPNFGGGAMPALGGVPGALGNGAQTAAVPIPGLPAIPPMFKA